MNSPNLHFRALYEPCMLTAALDPPTFSRQAGHAAAVSLRNAASVRIRWTVLSQGQLPEKHHLGEWPQADDGQPHTSRRATRPSTTAREFTNTRTCPSSTRRGVRACSHCIFASELGIRRMSCCTSACAAPVFPTATDTSSDSASRTRCFTLWGSVALNSSVCRSGRVALTID